MGCYGKYKNKPLYTYKNFGRNKIFLKHFGIIDSLCLHEKCNLTKIKSFSILDGTNNQTHQSVYNIINLNLFY